MFHCLVIKVVLLPALCDSLFRLSHPEDLVKNFFLKFFRYFQDVVPLSFSYLFQRLDYFTISSVDCQQLIQIFWKLIYFSVFQKQFLATACLYYHYRKEKSSTFFKFYRIFFQKLSYFFHPFLCELTRKITFHSSMKFHSYFCTVSIVLDLMLMQILFPGCKAATYVPFWFIQI